MSYNNYNVYQYSGFQDYTSKFLKRLLDKLKGSKAKSGRAGVTAENKRGRLPQWNQPETRWSKALKENPPGSTQRALPVTV